jgi:hypothetical protein
MQFVELRKAEEKEELVTKPTTIIVRPVIFKNLGMIIFPSKSFACSFSALRVIKVSDIDFVALDSKISNSTEIWPLKEKLLYQIDKDYGRSHYFFTNGDDIIPRLIHKYAYRNWETASDEECVSFFNSLGVGSEVIPGVFEKPSPKRNNYIVRTKYELLKRFFSRHGKSAHESSKLSLLVLLYTCQNSLVFVKGRILEELLRNIPQLHHTAINRQLFCYFRTNVHINHLCHAYLEISFINNIPKTGNWQSLYTLQSNFPQNIFAIFSLDLENQNDTGSISIQLEGPHDHFNKKISSDHFTTKFGIYKADKSEIIPFIDKLTPW